MNALANKSVAVALILAGVAARVAVADEPAKPAAGAAGTRQVSGRVLGPDGTPVAGAKLFTVVHKGEGIAPADVEVPLLGTTDGEGRFTVSVPPPGKKAPRSYVIAYAPAFGVDWLQFGAAAGQEPLRDQTLRLVEDVPITGRVVNALGRPVAGASVAVTVIREPEGRKLDAFLAAWKADPLGDSVLNGKSLLAVLSPVLGPTTTDRDGRFTLRGAGAERSVTLRISGGGIARSAPYVITRPGLDLKPYNEPPAVDAFKGTRRPIRLSRLYGPDFTLVAEAGKVVTGVISDAVTGEPVPGCRVLGRGGSSGFATDQTDARGGYRLDGLPKTVRGYEVSVTPPEGTTFLARAARASDTEGDAPVRLDVPLARGAVVTGRVVDKKTGKGVRALVRVATLPTNKLFGTKPEYTPGFLGRGGNRTDDDGRFRLVTLPGPGVIVASVMGGVLVDREINRYRSAVPDPEHKELFRRLTGDSWVIDTAGEGFEMLSVINAVKVIDANEAGEIEVVLTVAPGATGKVEVQDAAGRPLAGARISGLTEARTGAVRITGASATVYALDPDQPRTLVICHPDKKLGGSVTIRGDEKVVAKLAPLGRFTGRLVDEDGKPLAGVGVSFVARERNAMHIFDATHPRGACTSDEDGRFTLESVVPGIAFQVLLRKGEKLYFNNRLMVARMVEPGKTLDLGDLTLQPVR